MIEIKNIKDIIQHIDGLKAVVFDLDDNLYGEKEYIKSGYRAVAKVIPGVYNAADKLWTAFEDKKSAIDEVLLAESIYTDELKQKCLSIYRTHIPEIHLYEGVENLFETLRKKGLKLGIITDGRPEGQRAKIKSLNLEAYVDNIIITDELGGIEFRKPNEKAFYLMREQLGIDFSEMCYVGDNIKKDFIAPDKLGMKSIRILNNDGLYCALK